MPPAVEIGKTAVLECHFDQEGDALYSLKWYKGRREFFRFTPRDEPIIKHFPIAGLNVNVNASNSTHVVIDSVILDNTGEYLCEVTVEAPSFYTVMKVGILQVSKHI